MVKRRAIHHQGNWVPYPRSGLCFPEGQEWVMDDVPKGVASFGQTYWLKNDDDGVEKPDPDDHITKKK
ncbi:hypothetical protein Patl1_35323 [Pistacia atlantica]|nr:hypothetical protein Patl1_35323 [Pistacia atlantica]